MAIDSRPMYHFHDGLGSDGNGDDKMLRRIGRVACCAPATAVTTAVSPPAFEIDAAEVSRADVVMLFWRRELTGGQPVFRKKEGNIR